MNKYGTCRTCKSQLRPIWFIDEETKTVNKSLIRTGRKRNAVSHLECDCCGNRECIDDSFDGNWHL